MIVSGILYSEGKSPCDEDARKQAMKQFIILSGQGVITTDYGGNPEKYLSADAKPYAEAAPQYAGKKEYRCPTLGSDDRIDGACVKEKLLKLINEIKPTVLVGATGSGK